MVSLSKKGNSSEEGGETLKKGRRYSGAFLFEKGMGALQKEGEGNEGRSSKPSIWNFFHKG